MVWNDGPWVRALRGGALIINELARASTSVKDACLALLDDMETCRIALPNGETVRPHSDFVCVSTSNDTPEECGMSAALVDRFDLILNITHPHPALIAKLDNGAAGLGQVIHASFNDPARAISPRRALTFLRLLKAFTHDEAMSLAFGRRANDVAMAWKLQVTTNKGGK